VVEYAFHEIPSDDHAIIFPLEHPADAGPVATNRFPFHEIEFAPYGNSCADLATAVQRRPVIAYSAGVPLLTGVSVE
jgi:hypothetical protein